MENIAQKLVLFKKACIKNLVPYHLPRSSSALKCFPIYLERSHTDACTKNRAWLPMHKLQPTYQIFSALLLF